MRLSKEEAPAAVTGCSPQRSSGQLAGWGGKWAPVRAEAGASFLPGGYLGEKAALRAVEQSRGPRSGSGDTSP